MMNNLLCLVCILGGVTFSALVRGAESFLISQVVYPDIEDYTSLIEDIYTELGYKVSIVPTPSTRGLLLLDDGLVDADVVRASSVARQFANVIIVQPALKVVDLNLVCVMGVPCNPGILQDESLNILANDRIIALIGIENFRARKVDNEMAANVSDMLKAQRYFYALFAMDETISRNFAQEFQLVRIFDLSVHHVIGKKHEGLLPLIEQKLREKLPAFKAKRASNE
jgi:hypothetical protein